MSDQAGFPPDHEPSPWSRPTSTSAQPPAPVDPAYLPPDAPGPRFAGQPYSDSFTQPVTQPVTQPFSQLYEPPWQPPGAAPQGMMPPDVPRRRRGLGVTIGVAVLVVALVAGLLAVLVSTGGTSKKSGSASPLPGAAPIPLPSPSPAPTPGSSGPVPQLGLIATPPALLRIGYHAYSSELLDPSDIALGPQELVQFTKYGLSRTVSLRAFTLGDLATNNDDYDATINVLKFRDAAGAKAELDYSNSQNKKDAPVIALPGLPGATGFYNKPTSTDGPSVGAFATSGRYQVVVLLGGLARNDSTDQRAFAAEAARVLKAVLPIASTIEPADPGGGTPQIPEVATPSPTGTRA